MEVSDCHRSSVSRYWPQISRFSKTLVFCLCLSGGWKLLTWVGAQVVQYSAKVIWIGICVNYSVWKPHFHNMFRQGPAASDHSLSLSLCMLMFSFFPSLLSFCFCLLLFLFHSLCVAPSSFLTPHYCCFFDLWLSLFSILLLSVKKKNYYVIKSWDFVHMLCKIT